MLSVKRQAQAFFKAVFGRCAVCAIVASSLAVCTASAAVTRTEFDTGVNGTLAKVAKEASSIEGSGLVGEMIQREYGAPVDEIMWARQHELAWGTIVAFAYVRATTGQSFEELEKHALASNLWDYIEKSGMSADKMVHSLDAFLKRVEQELSLIHISEPTRLLSISYAVFCLKK